MEKTALPVKYILILLLGVTAIVILLVWTKPVNQPVLLDIPAASVVVTQVKSMDLHPKQRLSGYLQPKQKALLHFEVVGQVIERLVEPGWRVEQGTVLLSLASGDYQDAVDEASAQLSLEHSAVKRDRQLLEYVKKNRQLQANEVKRLEQLRQESLASKAKLDQAAQGLLAQQSEEERLRYNVETAKTRLKQSELNLRKAERNLERTRLTAPFSGVVNAVHVQQGDYVSPNQAVLELLQTDELDLYLEVGSKLASALQLGQQVSIAINGFDLQGKIIALQNNPDPQTFTYALRIRIPGQDILPGTFAHVELPLKSMQHALVVPVSAILKDDGKSYLFTVNEDLLQRVPVITGIQDGQQQVILEGANEGDVIVARDVSILTDGSRVEY